MVRTCAGLTVRFDGLYVQTSRKEAARCHGESIIYSPNTNSDASLHRCIVCQKGRPAMVKICRYTSRNTQIGKICPNQFAATDRSHLHWPLIC